MSEAHIKLMAMADSVDLNKLGVDSTWKHPMSLELRSVSMRSVYQSKPKASAPEEFKNWMDYEKSQGEEMTIYCHDDLTKFGAYDWLKRVLIAQALMDNISSTEAGLSVRWLMPFDLAGGDPDENYDAGPIYFHDWHIPANMLTFSPDCRWTGKEPPIPPRYKDPNNPTKDEKRRYENYLEFHAKLGRHGYGTSNRETIWNNYHKDLGNKNRSVLLLFGVGRGYNSSGIVQSLMIKRANVKTIEIVSLAQAEKGKIAILEHPCLFKRGDLMEIDVGLPQTGWEDKRDEIVLAGWVCEALGNWQTG